MNASRKNKYKKSLTRRCNAFISLLLCIALTGSLLCLPAFAVPETGVQSTPKSSGAQLYGADKSELSPVGNSGVTVKDGDDTDYVFVRDLSDTSVGYFKSCFRNKASQIKVFRDGAELADTDTLSTDCTVECVSSVDSSVVYETAKAVVFCDVDGDGGFDDDDITAIMNKAVTGTDDLITDGSAYFEAADCTEDGVVDGFDISVADLVLSQSKNCINFEKVNYNEFTTKFEHTDKYLYRVGNGNTVKLGSLFEVSKAGDSPVVSANVNIGAYSIDDETSVTGSVSNSNLVSDSTAKCVYTRNASDWTQSTLKFTDEGPVELSISDGDGRVYYLNLEVVNANNATTAVSATSANIVLLNDVSTTGRLSVSKTVYGNGFSITDNRAKASTTTHSGFINASAGAVFDNVRILGQLYNEAVPAYQENGTPNQEFSPCISISGDISVYNSYISGCRSVVEITGGNVYMENTVLDGGRVANADISGGNVTLKDCSTTTSTRDGKAALGIMVSGSGAELNLQGTFKQYNWLSKAQVDEALPTTYGNLLNSYYSGTTYSYTNNGTKYVNMGILFFAESTQFTTDMAQGIMNDQTSNSYAYEGKSVTGGYKVVLYSARGTSGTPEMLVTPTYASDGQYYTMPVYSFDFTNKNYIEKVAGDNNYCYYDSTKGTVNISFDKEDDSTVFNWDTDILTLTKYGHSLSSSVTMDGVDYTGESIAFAESGEYEVVYTYTDPQNYDADLDVSSHTYIKTVNIVVTAVEPDVTIYHPEFTYPNIGDHSSKTVIANNKTYVMPNVSTTSSDIGSKTIDGKTIYYPIITLPARNDSNSSNYSSGNIWYFTPAFRDINIVDKNKDTGVTLYTYNTSAQKWPHNISATTKPTNSGDYYGYVGTTHPWQSNSGDSGRSAKYMSGLGLCFVSGGFNTTRSGGTQLVEFYYKANDGVTYYYYISFVYPRQEYSSCVAEGTLVTMADGTKKPIEQINQGDMVMTWSLWNGCYEAQPVTVKWYHGTNEWNVLTLHFSDGTDVRTINQHGFFDADMNKYVYIKPDNVSDYTGHRFIKQNGSGENETVVLTGYSNSVENVGCYSLLTAYNESFMVEDMLSMTGEDYAGRFDYFDIGDGMKYDREKMQADIERYGLYSYEDFSDYLTPMQFELFNGKYFKVLVGRGILTYEDILGIIRDNL